MNTELEKGASAEEVTPTPVVSVPATQGDHTGETKREDCSPQASAIVSLETRTDADAAPTATAGDPAPDKPTADATTISSVAPTKPARLTDEQIKEHDLARRSDGNNDDWVTLYLEEFPPEEQRDVEQLRGYVQDGSVALHETRNKDGQLVTWSISQDLKRPEGSSETAFWLGCWTVTKRASQSSGIGRVHFPRVIEALKLETPDYVGRVTEIESTENLSSTSQPVRRAKFYQALGLQELDIDYQMPLYQPADATEYMPQSKLGKAIKGQLLIAPFSDGPVTGAQVRAIVRRIYEEGYDIQPTDPYIAERLALIDEARENYLVPLRILSAADASSTSNKPEEQSK